MYKLVGVLSLALFSSNSLANSTSVNPIKTYQSPQGQQLQYHTQSSLQAKSNAKNTEHVSVIVEFDEKPLFTLKNQSKSSIKKAEQNLKAKRNQVLSELKAKKVTTQFTREFSRLLNGAAFDINKQDLAALKSVNGIRKVHLVQDRYIHLHDSVNLIQADSVWQQVDAEDKSITGEGITVAVLDTGIDYTREELGGCFGEDCRVKGGYDYMNDDDDPIDDDGHGTHVAGIIGAKGSVNGVAPDVEFLAYKVCDYYCPTDGIIAALEAAVDPDGDPSTDDGADIINMSLGGPGSLDDPLTVAVNALEEHDVLVVISAGNEGSGPMTIGSPGNAEYAITVASTDKTDFLADYSSRGPVFSNTFQKPDIAAPGSSIDSLAIGSGLVSYSGTSMAAPHVAGAAALLKQNRRSLTARQLKSVLTSTTEPLLSSYLEAGAGRLNALSAVNSPIAMSISQVFMGKVDRNVAKWQAEKTITLTNITDTEQTYSLSIPDEDKSISYSLSVASEQTLAAGAKLDVTISVSVDTENVVAPGNLVHFANLEVSTDDTEATLPLLVLNAVELSWSSDNYPSSVWLNKKDGQLEITQEYQPNGGVFLLNGDYILSAIFDNYEEVKWVATEFSAENQDISYQLDDIEAPHRVSVTSFTDHQGNERSLDELAGGGVYAEIAHPNSNKRHFKFFIGWSNEVNQVYVGKPLYISSLLPEYEFSFSLMYGDTESSAYDQHIYLYSQTLSGVDNDVEIALDGQVESQLTIDTMLPSYLDDAYKWYLYSNLEPSPYFESGWLTSGAGLRGPKWFEASEGIEEVDQQFKITLHGNATSNYRVGHYSLNMSGPELLVGSTVVPNIRFDDNGASYGYGTELNSPVNNLLSIDAESVIAHTNIYRGSGETAYFNYHLKGADGVQYTDALINSHVYTCDNSAYNRLFERWGYASIDLTPFAACDNKQVSLLFNNYLAGQAYLSSATSDIPDKASQSFKAFTFLDLDKLKDIHLQTSDDLSLTGRFLRNYSSMSLITLTAYINYQGEWVELPVELEQDAEYVNFSIAIEQTSQPYLASLKLNLQVSDNKAEMILNGAFVLGGSSDDLAALDRDEDGINDLVDLDSDNDGITNDIELLSGLNPFDDSDASEDIDGDGMTNLEEAQVGRLVHIKDTDEYNDSDGDGVLDEFDDFPNNPEEFVDSDKDGIGNNADTDDDNDGVEDSEDAFPLDASESVDTDGDGIGNNADTDDDNDGVADSEDAFPFDPYESVDTDGDGIGNNADSDDDGDGVLDTNDAYPLDPSRSTNTTTPVTNPEPSSSGGGSVFWLMLILVFTYFSRARRNMSRLN